MSNVRHNVLCYVFVYCFFMMADISAITGIPEDANRNGQRPSPPELEGFLSKLKHKNSLFGSWTKRYFKVNSQTECIEYFKSKAQAAGDNIPTGSISLGSLTAVRKFDGCCFQIEAGPEVYLLLAESAAEQTCWIRDLQTYLAERKVLFI